MSPFPISSDIGIGITRRTFNQSHSVSLCFLLFYCPRYPSSPVLRLCFLSQKEAFVKKMIDWLCIRSLCIKCPRCASRNGKLHERKMSDEVNASTTLTRLGEPDFIKAQPMPLLGSFIKVGLLNKTSPFFFALASSYIVLRLWGFGFGLRLTQSGRLWLSLIGTAAARNSKQAVTGDEIKDICWNRRCLYGVLPTLLACLFKTCAEDTSKMRQALHLPRNRCYKDQSLQEIDETSRVW